MFHLHFNEELCSEDAEMTLYENFCETKKMNVKTTQTFFEPKNLFKPRVTSLKTRNNYKFTDATLCRAAFLQNRVRKK